MKKFISIIMLILAFSILTACKSAKEIDINKLEKSNFDTTQQSKEVTLSVKEETINTKAESITLIYNNLSDKEYTYGQEPHLEVEADGVWYTVKTLENVAWDDIGYILSPKDNREDRFSIKNNYGELGEGNYRIVKTLYSNGESIYSIAKFTVA
ncbi:MAG: hypothetical protein K0R09_30 [Clostridiales bacterium]|jgi:hypothetical protein|nr:hypothetical protein [Clostridiales bacterium]